MLLSVMYCGNGEDAKKSYATWLLKSRKTSYFGASRVAKAATLFLQTLLNFHSSTLQLYGETTRHTWMQKHSCWWGTAQSGIVVAAGRIGRYADSWYWISPQPDLIQWMVGSWPVPGYVAQLKKQVNHTCKHCLLCQHRFSGEWMQAPSDTSEQPETYVMNRCTEFSKSLLVCQLVCKSFHFAANVCGLCEACSCR